MKLRQTFVSGCAVVLVLVAGCKTDGDGDDDAGTIDGGGTTFSCVVSVANVTQNCTLYEEVPADSVATLKADCTKTGTPTIGTSCSSTGVTGSCTHAATSTSTFAQVEYAYSADGASDLEAQCSDGGGTYKGAGSTADAGSACAEVAPCCKKYTSFESSLASSCTAAVASGDEEMCHTALISAMAAISCPSGS